MEILFKAGKVLKTDTNLKKAPKMMSNEKIQLFITDLNINKTKNK